MKWKFVEVPDDDPEGVWTDAELIGVSILLYHKCGEPKDEQANVYYRAWKKLQDIFHRAANR